MPIKLASSLTTIVITKEFPNWRYLRGGFGLGARFDIHPFAVDDDAGWQIVKIWNGDFLLFLSSWL